MQPHLPADPALGRSLRFVLVQTRWRVSIGTSAMRAETSEESHTVKSVIAILGVVAALALGALLSGGTQR